MNYPQPVSYTHLNGAEGLDKALKFVPDIIISDIMMPEKDGITMTEDLRANMATSHIPVSYTHLDVYKRQMYGRVNRQKIC